MRDVYILILSGGLNPSNVPQDSTTSVTLGVRKIFIFSQEQRFIHALWTNENCFLFALLSFSSLPVSV